MTRAEVILALQKHARGEGPEIEWVCPTGVVKCRWHSEHGPQYLGFRGEWTTDAMKLHGQYREVWTPREFLGKWVEVKTFEEAEPADSERHAVIAIGLSQGGFVALDTVSISFKLPAHWAYVARKAGV